MPSFRVAFLLVAAAFARCTFSHPIAPQTPFISDADASTQCFTPQAAIASDCQSLFASPPPADWTNIAAGATDVFKPFCNASCCVYTNTAGVPTDVLVRAGKMLLGCTQRANGLVNGITRTDAAAICLADSKSVNGCF
ncbi:hypothetical protein FB45DRAFT_922752 [Roridomyces roridus]|uniref:Uncharacterized protein n=1 Tax=Roridomyces roridus TaxID=1738132 RepID=A0AAD7BNZ2_9AGAR|nr:hypothetical protein FB45DRAFT_922752 [Roridomyces roridus]